MEDIYVLIGLVIAAVLFVWITVAAILAVRRGERLGSALKAWARGLVEIIFGFG